MAELPRTQLVAKHDVAEGTMAFEFAKPDGFTFTAGQFADYTLIDPPQTDAEGDIRGFSLANPPYADTLMAATRMRDTAFKRVLRDLPIGTEVLLDAPYGSFTLHRNTARRAVFLTGGIGITPVRSILLQAAHDDTGHDITVFYANNRTQDAAFLDELLALGRDHTRIDVVAAISKPEESDEEWTGETGYVTADMLHRHLDAIAGPIYYLCGPPGMVKAMRGILDEAGVDPDDIRTEEFDGY